MSPPSWIQALGIHNMWGFSPAKDLLSAEFSNGGDSVVPMPDGGDKSAIKILLVCPSDPRHVIKTIAARNRSHHGDGRPLHFYILEKNTEIHARHLLLLHTFCDKNIPLRQRASIFLEVFGNALVRSSTESYIETAGQALIELLYNNGKEQQGSNLAHIAHFDLLKQRERDALEKTFQSWDASVPFDVTKLRDQRLRHYYGGRYDSRENVLDWDYETKVKLVASIIHTKQYREWRQTGLAFHFGCATYNAPNRSCASFAEGMMAGGRDRGMCKQVKGYWADILVSPYIAFGVDCDRTNEFADHLFQIVNKGTGSAQHRHNCVEVAMYNMLSFMWEVETGKAYTMKTESDVFSGLGNVDQLEGTQTLDDVSEAGHGNGRSEQQAHHKTCIEGILDNAGTHDGDCSTNTNSADEFFNIKIMLIGENEKAMLSKKAYKKMFDIVYVSQQGSHIAENEGFNTIIKDRALIIMESGKYIFPLTTKKRGELITRTLQMASGRGWKSDLSDTCEMTSLLDLDVLHFRK